MTERLAEVSRRIGTTRQLGAVVNAVRGIAAARATQSRALLPAVRAYAGIAARAIGQARRLAEQVSADRFPVAITKGKPGLLVFGAEEGFAGAFVEQVLDATAAEFADAHVFLVGSRSTALAAERGFAVAWNTDFPSRASAIPDTATGIVEALYAYLSEADSTTESPLTNLPAADLLIRLGEEYVFALVCEAAMEAFAAENEARMATMAAAKSDIDGKLTALEAQERRIRQEEVTAEVVELAAGSRARRQHRLKGARRTSAGQSEPKRKLNERPKLGRR